MSPAARRPWIVALGSAVLFPASIAAGAPSASPTTLAPRVASPNPAPFRHATAERIAAASDACEGCHREIAAEWRGSMHAASDSDPAYQRALALEPRPFCRRCHTPEASPEGPAPKPLAAMGVGCVTCHVQGELASDTPTVVAVHALADGGSAPHGVLAVPSFGTETACAGCHEFEFPDASRRSHAEKMQSTVTEHAASPFAAASCSSCHMKTVGLGASRHRSHAFPGGHDTALVRSAVTVDARRPSDDRLVVSLAPHAIGHAFPTGDLFRRVVVSAEVIGDDWNVLGETSRALHRRFRVTTLGGGAETGKVLVRDDRIPADGQPRTITLALPAIARGHDVAYRAEYQRVEHPVDSEASREGEAGDAVIEGAIELGSGVLPAPSRGRGKGTEQ